MRNLGWFSGYACGCFSDQVSEQQPDRISDCTFTGCFFQCGGEEDYFTEMLHSFWQQNKWIGKSGSDVMGNLPAFNADYILTYLSSVYGTIAAILFMLCSGSFDFRSF